MKKRMVILMVLCLILSGSGGAEQKESIGFKVSEKNFNDVFSDGKQFYIHSNGSYYQWNPEAKEPVFIMQGEKKEIDSSVTTFFYNGNFCELDLKKSCIYVLTENNKNVQREKIMSVEKEIFTEESKWSNEDITYKNISRLHCMNDTLFAILKGEEESELYVLNLKTGESTLSPFSGKLLTPYKDGKLLSVFPAGKKEDSNPFSEYYFGITDVKSGHTEKAAEGPEDLSVWDIKDIFYDEMTNTLYFLTDFQVYMLENMKEAKLCAEISGTGKSKNVWNFVGNKILIYTGAEFLMVTAEKNYQPLLPVVLSDMPWNSDTFQRSLASSGGMKVEIMPEIMRWEDISAAIISQSDQADIYIVRSQDVDMKSLMEKGYCVCLDDSEILSAFGKKLYPYLQEGCILNGSLYAVPLDQDAVCNQILYDWSELDLEKCNTFLDLCSLTDAWEREGYLDQYSNYIPSLMNGGNLIREGYQLYLEYMLASGQKVTLNTPLFRKIMQKAESVADTDNWLDVYNNEEELMYEKTHLVTNDTFNLLNLTDSKYKEILKLTDDTAPAVGFYVHYAVVNPYSKNIDQAIKYLESYTESMDSVTLTEMCPNQSEPIENPAFRESLEYIDWEINQIKNSIEKAADDEKERLQNRLTEKEKEREQYIEENQYMVTAEEIELYRSMDQGFFVRMLNPLDNEDIWKVLDRYVGGQIDLEQFIREAENKIQLIILENQ